MNDKLRILLADESRFFRAIESKFLQKTPVEILEADSSDAAIDIIRTDPPDLVYMAFSLPGIGGDECCRVLKNDPSGKVVPVVIICDQNEPSQPEIARQKGADAILVKPLDMHSFLQVGRQFLDTIREHRQTTLFSVTISLKGEEFVGKCLDISGGGMFVETTEEVSAGSLVNLTFRLPDSLGTRVNCCAEVMWVNRKPNPMKPHYPHGLGLKFVEIPDLMHSAVVRVADKKKSG